jgi:EAL and modified HD-GYP domain-containing signal transduction protein
VELFVARQPIFDVRGELSGYELLYRRGALSHGADGSSVEQMSLDVIIQSFLEIGLDRLTHGKRGFLNFSREMLVGGSWELLDPDSVVIELLETIEADAEVTAACERLVGAGYRLALDDYVDGGPQASLLDLATIVKLDVLGRPMEEIRRVSEPLRGRGLTLLAERVETAEVRDGCRDLGFELYQGYFFSRPELITRKGISTEQTAIIQLMNRLRDESVGDAELEETFRRDPALSFKLLRMVNSAAVGGRGIESILHAIRLLGRDALHRWLALLLASSLSVRGSGDVERIHSAVLRARMCEEMALAAGRHHYAGPVFMVGLFSRMDALMGTTLEELLGRIDLADDVRDALLERRGAYGDWLRLVEAYEAGEWEATTSLAAGVGLSALDLPEIYLDALGWVRTRVPLAA